MSFASLIERLFTQIRFGSSSGPIIRSGAGSPEGVLTAPVGSAYLRSDGGANTTFYSKESGAGNTGWIALTGGVSGGSSPPSVPFKTAVGRWLVNSENTTTLAATTGAANRMEIAPWLCPIDMTIDQFGVLCSTAVASSLMKIVVYAADADGRPTTLLLETGTLNTGTTGFKSIAAALSFVKGTLYWIGVRYSGAQSVNAMQPYCSPTLGFPATPTTVAAKLLRRTLTFATGATTPWVYSGAEETAANVPAVFFRIAS